MDNLWIIISIVADIIWLYLGITDFQDYKKYVDKYVTLRYYIFEKSTKLTWWLLTNFTIIWLISFLMWSIQFNS